MFSPPLSFRVGVSGERSPRALLTAGFGQQKFSRVERDALPSMNYF